MIGHSPDGLITLQLFTLDFFVDHRMMCSFGFAFCCPDGSGWAGRFDRRSINVRGAGKCRAVGQCRPVAAWWRTRPPTKKEKMSNQKCQFTSFGDLSENDVGQSQNQYPGRRLHDASRCHLIALWLARFNGPLTTTVALDDRPAEESHQLKL